MSPLVAGRSPWRVSNSPVWCPMLIISAAEALSKIEITRPANSSAAAELLEVSGAVSVVVMALPLGVVASYARKTGHRRASGKVPRCEPRRTAKAVDLGQEPTREERTPWSWAHAAAAVREGTSSLR